MPSYTDRAQHPSLIPGLVGIVLAFASPAPAQTTSEAAPSGARSAALQSAKPREEPAARALYDSSLATIRSSRSLFYKADEHFSAGGQEGLCSYRIWLKKPGLGRLEAVAPGQVTGVGDVVTGVIVGDGISFWIYWPAGFPGTRTWDPGHPSPRLDLYMQRNFAPNHYSFAHDFNLLGACVPMLPFQPSVFHGQVATPFEIEAVSPIGTEEVDGHVCNGILVSMAGGQRTAEFWISREDLLPRRIKAVAHTAVDIVVEETWTAVRLDEEMPDSLFRWTPGDGFTEYIEPTLESTLLPEGAEAPDFHATPLRGDPFRLSDLRGKVVLLNFWRIGCPPCRKELPVLQTLHQRLAEDGLVVIGYDEVDDAGRLSDLLEKTSVTYPCVLDTSRAGSRSGLGYTSSDRGSADPLTYLIGRDGKILSRWFGFSEETLHDALSRAGLRP